MASDAAEVPGVLRQGGVVRGPVPTVLDARDVRRAAPARRRPTVSVTRPGRPRTLNAERAGHHMAHRRETAAERHEWGWLWRAHAGRTRYLTPVTIVAQPFLSGSQQDTGNCYPSVKAAIDGLVDAGVIVEDGPAEIAAITLLAPIRCQKGEDRLTVTVSERTDR